MTAGNERIGGGFRIPTDEGCPEPSGPGGDTMSRARKSMAMAGALLAALFAAAPLAAAADADDRRPAHDRNRDRAGRRDDHLAHDDASHHGGRDRSPHHGARRIRSPRFPGNRARPRRRRVSIVDFGFIPGVDHGRGRHDRHVDEQPAR